MSEISQIHYGRPFPLKIRLLISTLIVLSKYRHYLKYNEK